jgi:hypothetical protein
MFNAFLLTPYRENEAHSWNFPVPPRELIQGEEEYEIEKSYNTTELRPPTSS